MQIFWEGKMVPSKLAKNSKLNKDKEMNVNSEITITDNLDAFN